MALEIEKKYLVNTLPENLDSFNHKEITQSYISLEPTLRLRQLIEKGTPNPSYVLTVKGKGHTVRQEFELDLTEEQYFSLLSKTENFPIKKIRYFIPIQQNLVAELDLYYENLSGLQTVEVEFSSVGAMEQFSPPDWFGADISQDKRYKNSFLSKYGLPK